MPPEKRALLLTLAAIGCGCIGLVCLIVAPVSYGHRATAAALLQSGVTTEATIKLLSKTDGTVGVRPTSRRTGTRRAVTVEYAMPSGETQLATASQYVGAPEYDRLKEGDRVTVVYPKERPYEVYLKDSLVRTQASGAWVGFAVAALIGIIGCIVSIKMGASFANLRPR